MSLSLGIIGLPNVGKSTLFNALLKKQVALAANYPFATIEPNVGVVDVPDDRLQMLVDIVKNEYGRVGDREVPEKVIPAVVKFVDIAGLVRGASEGEGLGNKFLSHIREVDAIVHVLRDFEDDNIVRADSTHPDNDKEIVETELALADLQVLSKRIEAEQRNARTGNKESVTKLSLFQKVENILSNNLKFELKSLSEDEMEMISDLNLLSLKPMIYVYNVSENSLIEGKEKYKGTDSIQLCAKMEEEISSLSEEEQKEYLAEFGFHFSGLDKVIKRGYDLLGLQSFFTAGPKEVRAWTINVGDTAPKAAGKIHTDFERGFISAEIVHFSDLISSKTFKGAKEKGLMRTEGKTYVMQDGDIVVFRFSV